MKSQPRKIVVKVLSIPEYERHYLEQSLNRILRQLARGKAA